MSELAAAEQAHAFGANGLLIPPLPSFRGGKFRTGFLDKCAIERRSQDIPTDGPVEAALMIACMLKHARGTAYFYSGRTNLALAGAPSNFIRQIRYSARQFLGRPGTKLKLATEESPEGGVDILALFAFGNPYAERVDQSACRQQYASGSFLVTNGRAYWMASAQEPRLGVGNFNDRDMASELKLLVFK